jgi:dTDP-4-dehydrorhamnose 3,5-epimerase
VEPGGAELARLPEGVYFRDCVTHVDDRGSLFEGYDSRWDWHPEPLVYSYFVTIRPGVIKGWALHRLHSDRYFIIQGEMEVLLYDDRPDSPTRGVFAKVYLTHLRRRLMTIPPGVWHADHNVGQSDVLLANYPTQPYDHKNPDKYRLPLNNDLIPYKFDNPKGW